MRKNENENENEREREREGGESERAREREGDRKGEKERGTIIYDPRDQAINQPRFGPDSTVTRP